MDGRADRRVRSARVSGRLKAARSLFPSDIQPTLTAPKRLRVAGRVIAASASRVELSDAFSVISVYGELAELSPGDLVVVSGRLEGRALVDARVEARKPGPLPRGDGELGRFIFSGVGVRLLARSRALASMRGYFAEQAFIEVETPLRVPAPGVDANVEAMRAQGGYLITSPELEMKRLVVAGVPRQFQFARVSRRDEAGSLHEPEFTLLEWYRAFSGQEEVLRDTEALVRRVAQCLRGRLELVTPQARRISVKAAFERMSVSDAFRRHAGVRDVADLAASDEGRYFELLVERVEPRLAELDRPIFLHDYPISQAALARPLPADPNFAERFELYVGGVELCNGYGELTSPNQQRARMRKERARRKAAGKTAYRLNERFLAALDEGMPDTGGNALGVDRLIMLALGAGSVQDVIAFPAAWV